MKPQPPEYKPGMYLHDQMKNSWIEGFNAGVKSMEKDPAIITDAPNMSKTNFWLISLVDVKTKKREDILLDKKILNSMRDKPGGLGLLLMQMVENIEETLEG